MLSTPGTIRPRAEHLRQLATLEVKTPEQGVSKSLRDATKEKGVDFRLELKLVTPRVRYWLCTKGTPEPAGPGHLWEIVTAGYVTMEDTQPNEQGTYDTSSYSPGRTNELQGMDYLNTLGEELRSLKERDAKQPGWETKKQIDATLGEMAQTRRSLGWQVINQANRTCRAAIPGQSH